MYIDLAVEGLLQELLQLQAGVGIEVCEDHLIVCVFALELEPKAVVLLVVGLLPPDLALLVANVVAPPSPAGPALVLLVVGVVEYPHAPLELGVGLGLLNSKITKLRMLNL